MQKLCAKTKDAEYLALTKKAHASLKTPEGQRIAASRFRHTLYCKIVKEWLESQGWAVYREYNMKPDGTTANERIDVLAVKDGKRIAYEVHNTFPTLLANVLKCIEIFEVDQVYVVCERQKPELDEAVGVISRNVPPQLYERIGFLTMSHFF